MPGTVGVLMDDVAERRLRVLRGSRHPACTVSTMNKYEKKGGRALGRRAGRASCALDSALNEASAEATVRALHIPLSMAQMSPE